MIFVFFFLKDIVSHQCISGLLPKSKNLVDSRNETKRKSQLSESSRKPIRIYIDTSIIRDKTDPLICTTAGQRIQWALGTYYCQQDDILTEKKIQVVESTMYSIQSYLSRLLNVSRCTFPIKSKNMNDITVKSKSYHVDLYVAVVTRPFGDYSSTLASAFPDSLSFFDNRPIRGGIYINARKIPSEAQNESSYDRKFFTTCLHEFCHILGISKDLYEYWLNRNTGNSWGSKIPMTKYTKDGKTFTILHTPQCQKYAMQRWNRTMFADGIPMGVELEDGGSTGTELSHPEGRVFFNELMVGISIQPAVISDLTLAMLEDTGWYECNYSMAEPLAWGEGSSLGGDKLQEFPVGPPYTAFPSNYLCNPTQSGQSMCSFDYSYVGECISVINQYCPGWTTEDKAFCKAEKFYNPLGFQSRGIYWIPDFIQFPLMSRNCRNPETRKSYTEENYGKNSICVMSNLSSYSYSESTGTPRCYESSVEEGILKISIGNETKICEKEGMKLNFTGLYGSVICPDPKLVIAMRNFENKSVYRPPRGKIPLAMLTHTIIIIVAASVFILIVIAAILSCIIGQIRGQKKVEEVLRALNNTESQSATIRRNLLIDEA